MSAEGRAMKLHFMGFVDGRTFAKIRDDLETNQDMAVSYGLGFRWESRGWDYEPELVPCYVGDPIGKHSTEDQRPLFAYPAQGWRPIETAPKDGTTVLLAMHGGHVAAGYYKERNGWSSVPGMWTYHPTHWMPLPEPPR